jgi:ribosomal protein S18 acetylase RimI-like enzyme
MPAFPNSKASIIFTNTIFRPATPADCQPIYENCQPPHTFAIFQRGFQNAIKNYGIYPIVGELNGQIVASGQLVRLIGYAEIADLIVAPQHRGQGIGTAMVNVLMQMASHLGMERVEIGVNAGNSPALALYLRLGFVEDRRLKVPHQPHPAIILSKDC